MVSDGIWQNVMELFSCLGGFDKKNSNIFVKLITGDMVFKKFYDQYFVPVSVFTRSDRGQGGRELATITTTFGPLNLA